MIESIIIRDDSRQIKSKNKNMRQFEVAHEI